MNPTETTMEVNSGTQNGEEYETISSMKTGNHIGLKFRELDMLIDDDTISGDYPVLIKLPNGDQKTVRLKIGSKLIPDIRLGKVRLPSMFNAYYFCHPHTF